MELSDVVAEVGGQSALAEAIGCDKSYVNRAFKRGRAGTALAVRIYRKLGHQTGPLVGATPEQIDALERMSIRGKAA